MENRRTFMQAATASAVVSNTVLGANDRINMGLIGCGNRGSMVSGFFTRHSDCQFVAACDVRKDRLDAFVEKGGGRIQAYPDYRRLLERDDIDAVLVATPDHWHAPITVDACAAGKDVYVEKPISNTIEAAQSMVTAARRYDRVIQCGLQQRSGKHFQEAAKLVQSGLLGKVTHAVLCMPGGYASNLQPTAPVPAELDWEMFQGPAPRRPFSPSYLRWRAFYAFGGGLITDWGVHLTDIVHMYLNQDHKGPILTSGSGQYVNVEDPDESQIPDAFVCNWQYNDFVMSFTNVVLPNPNEWSLQGTYFYGPQGVLHIHRSGYRVLPVERRVRPGQQAPKPIAAKTVPVKEEYQNDPDTIAHARNLLDCIKSRQKPISDIAIGFSSTLPCLLALMAVQQGRTFRWDGSKAWPI